CMRFTSDFFKLRYKPFEVGQVLYLISAEPASFMLAVILAPFFKIMVSQASVNTEGSTMNGEAAAVNSSPFLFTFVFWIFNAGLLAVTLVKVSAFATASVFLSVFDL